MESKQNACCANCDAPMCMVKDVVSNILKHPHSADIRLVCWFYEGHGITPQQELEEARKRIAELEELERYNDSRFAKRIEEHILKNLASAPFTAEEIDFLRRAIVEAILDCETNPPHPSDAKLNLMWSIKGKCDAILKGASK
nr:MAG TPA: hypothetical protein [Caudoviricetes sp.]